MGVPTRKISWSGPDPRRAESKLTREWLVANGLGGYASCTVAGVCTRRYHGLLVAALPNPLGLRMMFNHLAERLRLLPGQGDARGRLPPGDGGDVPGVRPRHARGPAADAPAGWPRRATAGLPNGGGDRRIDCQGADPTVRHRRIIPVPGRAVRE
jgi:hypothetical protein